MSNEVDVSRVKIKFLIEGLGEAEGELVRFMAPRTVDTITRKLPLKAAQPFTRKKSTLKCP